MNFRFQKFYVPEVQGYTISELQICIKLLKRSEIAMNEIDDLDNGKK